MFSESKDEIALILFGTPDTDNPLADGECYENITIAQPMDVASFELLETVQNNIQPSNVSADFVDALIVALDHLVSSTQGKKGFCMKRLILLSDLDGEFGDDQIDTVIAGIKNSGTELNVIGPSIEEDDDEDNKPGPSTTNGHAKAKTPQQRAGETMLKHILQEVEGECYSFSEALPALSYFQSRHIRQTAWKCLLEITSSLQIPICSYVKMKNFTLKQSWKKVFAKDADETVSTLRTYHMNDEEETEVEKEDIVEGHRYGNTLVPMSADDKENMKYKAVKCFKILGFTNEDKIKRHHYLGDGSSFVVAEKDDESAAIALSALANAMYETNKVAIVRKVYSAAAGPRLGCLIPHIKAEYECLIYIELPFREDIRQFTFGSLPITDDSKANIKHAPSADQLKAVDHLITEMDLSQSADDEEEKIESLKPKLLFNPHFQRLYQCLQHRALNPDDALPELSPLIANYLKPPQEIITKCEHRVEKIQKLFKLEEVKQKEERTGEKLFKDGDETEAGPVKKQKLDDDLEGGMEDITKAEVTEVGTVTPVEDYLSLVNRKDVDKFEDASKQMQKRIEQIVMDSFGAQFYPKAVDCLKTLRQQCIKKMEPRLFNAYMRQFKDKLIEKGRRDFWDEIVAENLALITKVESEESNISVEEGKKFTVDDIEDKPSTQDTPAEDDADDMLENM